MKSNPARSDAIPQEDGIDAQFRDGRYSVDDTITKDQSLKRCWLDTVHQDIQAIKQRGREEEEGEETEAGKGRYSLAIPPAT